VRVADKSVLVVGDFRAMTAVMSKIVQELGFSDIVTAHSGSEALHKLGSQQFGFILCDLEMHPMNGLELAFLIRQNPTTRKTVIILTTGNREILGRALSTAQFKLVDAYLIRPFTAEQLSIRLKDVAGRIRDPRQVRRVLFASQHEMIGG
jgi:CheY-like chemotaxis protein